MRFFLCFLLLLPLFSVKAHEHYIPQSFQEGQPIEEVILILDVDGVVRNDTNGVADLRVIESIKMLLKKNVNVTFISGTPVDNDMSLEPWKRGNIALNKVFGSFFANDITDGNVTIFGLLGAHRMKEDGSFEIKDEYSQEVSFTLCKLLMQAFILEAMRDGVAHQKNLAAQLQIKLNGIDFNPPYASHKAIVDEFYPIIADIRAQLDPDFRLLNNGSLIETHTSNPPWNTGYSSKWLKNEIEKPEYPTFYLDSSERHMSTGLTKKGDKDFNFLLISKTNKGITSKNHIDEKVKLFKRPLIITIGDTLVDYPMHRNAHLSFHVGLEKVWSDNPLPHCMMVRDRVGKDCQHVEGTLKVLELLNEAIGKSFYEFKHIPTQDASGQWDYCSVNELEL